jgi:hypothetical protein
MYKSRLFNDINACVALHLFWEAIGKLDGYLSGQEEELNQSINP